MYKYIKRNLSNLIFIPIYELIFKSKFHSIKIKSISETMEVVKRNKYAVVRFGDGEFKWMSGAKQNSFQEYSSQLGEQLLEVLNSTRQDVIVCLPQGFKEAELFKYRASKYWKKQIGLHGKKWFSYINKSKVFYNANITRPYMDFKNKDEVENVFETFKGIWKDKTVLVVEGSKTNFGVGNDLLNDARKIMRIECPQKNAFNKCSTILDSILKVDEEYKPDVILIALGPTATILGYKLAISGVHAIDIGHLDIEYDWYKNGAKEKEAIPGKYVNEVETQLDSEQVDVDKSNYGIVIDRI